MARSATRVGFLVNFLLAAVLFAAAPPDLEEQTREISAELRCVVCQNLSVADSPSEMAQQMRALVREQLQEGKTPAEVREFFVSKYGEWVLLKPKASGFSALLWYLPYLGLGVGLLAALWAIRRWTAAKQSRIGRQAPQTSTVPSNLLAQDFTPPDIEDATPRAQLLREAIRLKEELSELEFDFAAEKYSAKDYRQLRGEIESKTTAVLQQLSSMPAPAPAKPARKKTREPVERNGAANDGSVRRWRLVAGGAFLLVFGLALGVMLMQSIRPRTSESDSITGDFMTGTAPASRNVRTLLDEGKRAYSAHEFPKAIEAFRKALAADPNNAEAHTYMGFILVQAGHADGALMAFDRALAQFPDYPMALWGKGMVLYREQMDYAAAREIFEKLLQLIPPGEDRNEVAKILMEIPRDGGASTAAAPSTKGAAKPAASMPQITGRIALDPKLKGAANPGAVLFIIARATAAGPPLAVKKIDRPVFPQSYSLTEENVMMQGMPFSGKVSISARLDKDGNPATRTAGDLTGEYKQNPVEVGAANVDIVLDQVAK